LTPDAQVTSISATLQDRHEFIKFLVAELRRLKVENVLSAPMTAPRLDHQDELITFDQDDY